MPELRLPAILALSVAQCAIAAPYLMATAATTWGKASAVLCFVAPVVVFILFMAEIRQLERQFREYRERS